MNYLKLLLIILPLAVSPAAHAQFFEEDHLITDVRNNIVWLRCSVGQTWDSDSKTCMGELVKLNHDEIKIALQQASEQLGGEWRLPSLMNLKVSFAKHVNHQKSRKNTFQIFLPRLIGQVKETS